MARVSGNKWTVRVINPVESHPGIRTTTVDRPLPGRWVESLRYMGHVTVIKEYDGKDGYEVLEFHAPHGQDSKVWADHNADRMKTMGIDAAAAPEWKTGDRETLGYGFKIKE